MDTMHREGTTASKGRARPLVMAARAAAMAVMAGLLIVSSGEPADECHPRAKRDQHPDCGVHNMMVVGQQAIYLSHLPMFDSEHRFQVILEATLAKGGQSVSKVYVDDRRGHPDVRMYTLKPRDVFVLPRLFGTNPPPRRSFRGTLFRGHLERDGVQLDRLTGVEVTIKRVIYAQEIGATTQITRSDTLDYILFGAGAELFLAHRIAQPPDFDQIVGVKVSGHAFTSEELTRGVSIKIPDRGNTPDRRLRAKDKVAAQGHVTGAHMFLPLTVEVTAEFYLEEGELASPATFDQTPLEKAAGF
jgi:hypothetical protein